MTAMAARDVALVAKAAGTDPKVTANVISLLHPEDQRFLDAALRQHREGLEESHPHAQNAVRDAFNHLFRTVLRELD